MSSLPPGGGNNNLGGGDDNLDNFLQRGDKDDEKEALKKARAELLSDANLPISFYTNRASSSSEEKEEEEITTNNNKDDDDDSANKSNATTSNTTSTLDKKENDDTTTTKMVMESPGGAAAADEQDQQQQDDKQVDPDELLFQKNPYMAVVSRLTPSDLIRKFTSTAHPRVQDAVRATILGLIGNLPKQAFDTTTMTTGERLASLMFQLQMTGYMFKNAEYRLSLSQSLGLSGIEEITNSKQLLMTGNDLLKGKVKGKIKVHYGSRKRKAAKKKMNNSTGSSGSDDDDVDVDVEIMKNQSSETTTQTDDNDSDNGDEKIIVDENKDDDDEDDDDKKKKNVDNDDNNDNDDEDEDDSDGSYIELEVDAEAYLSELRDQVKNLRSELLLKREAQQEEMRKDLLLYIRTLPKEKLDSLTAGMSKDVLVAMKGLVNVVLAGIGNGQIGPDTVTEQSSEAMAQLCMWQLVVGYNLRELEVREEMKKSLSPAATDDVEESGFE